MARVRLLSLLLLAMLLSAQLPSRVALATPRPDTPTLLTEEFLAVINNICFL
ncbi:MAG: hypothetical protein LM580_09395 [Thermofilum sp.]|nr:hypothetical protein [Thermofilum sp.]